MIEEIENKRRHTIDVEALETSKAGYSNGISTQLKELIDKGEYRSLNDSEKDEIIKNASLAYGQFLDALGCTWREDPNSMETPTRVSKMFVMDLWRGRYDIPKNITSFPADNYSGVVLEKDIPLVSLCSHHHQAILGKVHIAYIPGENGEVIGLSKLNRIVEHFGRRGAIQEALTVSIHNAVNYICKNNIGVMVVINATHQCVSLRGVKHSGASMVTSEVSGVFADHTKTAKQEVLDLIK